MGNTSNQISPETLAMYEQLIEAIPMIERKLSWAAINLPAGARPLTYMQWFKVTNGQIIFNIPSGEVVACPQEMLAITVKNPYNQVPEE